MKIFITGVSCVGKSTIGKRLSEKFGYKFFDFDTEVEKHFSKSIERLKNEHLTEYSFRHKKGSLVLNYLVNNNENSNYVIALPPSGLMDFYFKIFKRIDCTIIVLRDRAVNILNRLTFYDIDSNQIDKDLSESDKDYYLEEIRKDMSYFGRTYNRAHLSVNINGLSIEEGVSKIQFLLSKY